MISIVGKDTLVMELTPRKLQAGYLSMISLVTMFGLLGASTLCRFLWVQGGLPALALTAASLCFCGFVALIWVQDPRANQFPTMRGLKQGLIRFMR